jgi:hypothetical protein
VVVADSFFKMPGGSVPEVIAHEYGVQPLLALITAEYVLFTVPFGRLVVVIVMFAKHCDAKGEYEGKEGEPHFSMLAFLQDC